VGIRKVLGASPADIVFLFGREFIILIGIAFLLAAPAAYYFMNHWLEGFAYRIRISAGIFLMSIGVSVGIAALTIVFQSIKAARANLVKSIRTE
jgi:putative ABC transport system permease protein